MKVVLVLLLYAVGWYKATIALTRLAMRNHERDWHGMPIEHYRGEMLFWSGVLALIWPLVAVGYALYGHLDRVVGLSPKQAEAENRRLREDIERLEREARLP